MTDKANYVAQLLIAQRKGLISSEKLIELNSFLDSDQELYLLSEKINTDTSYVYHALQDYDRIRIPDVKLITDQVNQPSDNKGGLYSYSNKIWYIAASLVFLIGIGFLFHLRNTFSTDIEDEVSPMIAAGTNKATMILSDGNSYELSHNKDGVMVDKNSIKYTTGGTIALSNKPNMTAILDVPRGGQYYIELSDGTRVWLNAQSKLKYPLTFTSSQRIVELEGEAYFEVAHNASKPFVVKMNDDQQVEVLGTSFNIQAYPFNDNQLYATLLDGSVRLRSQQKAATLKPGQQALASKDNITIQSVNAQQYVLWKEGVIVLDKQDVYSIIPQLERWYDVEFEFVVHPKDTPTLSGEIPRDIPLNSVLDVLTDQLKLKFEIKGRRVMVKI